MQHSVIAAAVDRRAVASAVIVKHARQKRVADRSDKFRVPFSAMDDDFKSGAGFAVAEYRFDRSALPIGEVRNDPQHQFEFVRLAEAAFNFHAAQHH